MKKLNLNVKTICLMAMFFVAWPACASIPAWPSNPAWPSDVVLALYQRLH